MTASVEIPRLRELIVRRLEQSYPTDHAERMADSILFGEMIRRPSHGISRLLPGTFGPMDEMPSGEPVVDRTSPNAARITGGPGILVTSIATDMVGTLASEHGMAVVATTGSHSTSGSLSYYIEQLTKQGLVALITTNTVSFVAPSGGTERLLGTNPIAIGVPALGLPFIADLGTSAITGGELIAAAGAGDSIPGGVAVDASGEVTTDPKDVLGGGALLAFGGHKGLALSMAVQLLSGVFGQSNSLPLTGEHDWSHVLIAISLESLGDPEEMKRVSQDLIDRILATPVREGSDVRIPGHRSLSRRDAAIASGAVDVDEEVFAQLTSLVG